MSVTIAVAKEAGPKEILKWNKRKALSCLLAMEEHLIELKEEEIPHSWCIVKHHLLLLDHHLYEAIGHAERCGENPAQIRRFREKVLNVEAYPEPHLSVGDVVSLRTEWRQIIKDPTLGAECPLCESDIAQVLQRTHFQGSDEERAEAMLTKLSSCLGVSKPRFKIIDAEEHLANHMVCTVSGGGLYSHNREILLCRGSVTPKNVAHEFYHYLSHLDKPTPHVEDPLEEEKARKFAEKAVEADLCPQSDRKELNKALYNHNMSGRKMVKSSEILQGLGGAIIGVGVDIGAGMAETSMAVPNLKLGADVVMAVGGVGGLLASAKLRASKYSSVLLGIGLAGVVKTIEILAGMIPAISAVSVAVAPTAIVTPTRTIPVPVPRVALPAVRGIQAVGPIAMELGAAEVSMPTYTVSADAIGYRVGR